MGFCSKCREVWTSRQLAHCSACCRSFKSVSGWTKHRVDGRCKDPLDLGMVMKEGIWAHPMSESAKLAKRAAK